jgi:recombination DNA repair RAD52 pathway protein
MECLVPIRNYFNSLWDRFVQKVKYIKRRYFTKNKEKTIEITKIHNIKKEDVEKEETNEMETKFEESIDNMEKGIEDSSELSAEKEIDLDKIRNRKRKRRNSSDKISDKWETIDIPDEESSNELNDSNSDTNIEITEYSDENSDKKLEKDNKKPGSCIVS